MFSTALAGVCLGLWRLSPVIAALVGALAVMSFAVTAVISDRASRERSLTPLEQLRVFSRTFCRLVGFGCLLLLVVMAVSFVAVAAGVASDRFLATEGYGTLLGTVIGVAAALNATVLIIGTMLPRA